MNPIQTVKYFDMHRRIRAGFMSLPSALPDPSLNNGNIVSEVGEPVVMRFPAYEGPMLVYHLRKQRKVKFPKHIVGKAIIGDAFAAFLPRIVQAPAIGTVQRLQPRVTYEQSELISKYRFIQADAVWIIHVPSPLGVGIMLEVFAPEVDTTTETRGIRIKPAGANTTAVFCPWSSDISMVDRVNGRLGQSGGAINIRTVEDNTIESVNTPLNITIYQMVCNIKVSGKIPSPSEDIGVVGLSAIDATPPTPLVEHGDEAEPTIEVNAEGGADVMGQTSVDATPASVIAPGVEEPVGAPATTDSGRSTRKQQGLVGARWFEVDPLVIDSSKLLTWVNITIDPYYLTKRGDNLSLAYRRNFWVSGSSVAGYIRTVKTKWIVARSPQISGVLEVQDSRNDSSRSLVEFGGQQEVDLVPRNFAGAVLQGKPRYYNNAWLRTNEAMCDARFRLTAFNRTADVADVRVRILARAGNAYFDVPTKPRPKVSPTVAWMIDLVRTFVEQKDLQILAGTPIPFEEHGDDEGENTFDSENHVAPRAGNEPYWGEINAGGAFNEDLDQDDFAVKVWEGVLPNNGAVVTIPMNLAVAPDLNGTGGESTIAQKFERNAHVFPTQPGNLGPRIGTYTIETRLPATIAGNIAHLSLPGDMVDEAVALSFGLGDILSMATSAISAVGGPTINAGIAAGRAIFGLLKGIGGKPVDQVSTESTEQPSLSGPLEISRFVNFLKPIAQNEMANSTFGQLLLQARDFIGSDASTRGDIPARVWARMNNAQVERQVFNRTVVPAETMANEVYLPYDRIDYLIERFGAHPNTFISGTFQNSCWLKFMTVLRKKIGKPEVQSLSLKEILEYEVTQEDETALASMMASKRFIVEP